MSFANALSSQLNNLKKQENNPILPLKGTSTFLFDFKTSTEVSNEDVYQLGIYGIINLCRKDFTLKEFTSSLFSSTSKYFNRDTALPEEAKTIDEKVNNLLLHLSENFLNTNCHKILEFLFRIYKVNVYNSERLILSFLPFHSNPFFTKLIQNVNFSSKHIGGGFGFMSHYAENGHVLLPQIFHSEIFKDFNLVYKIIDFFINSLMTNKDINLIDSYSMFIVNLILKCTEYYSSTMKGIKRKINDINNFDIDNFLRLITNFIVSTCENSHKITNANFFKKFLELQLLLVSNFNLSSKFVNAMMNQILYVSEKIIDNRKFLNLNIDEDEEEIDEDENKEDLLFEEIMKTILAILLELQSKTELLHKQNLEKKNELSTLSISKFKNSLDELILENKDSLVCFKPEYVKSFLDAFSDKIIIFSKSYDIFLLVKEILHSKSEIKVKDNNSFSMDVEIIKFISDCNLNDTYMTNLYIISCLKELKSIKEFIEDSRPHLRNNLFMRLYLKEEFKSNDHNISDNLEITKASRLIYNSLKSSTSINSNQNDSIEKEIMNNVKNLFSEDYKTLSEAIKTFDSYIMSQKDLNKVLYFEIFVESLVLILLRSKNNNIGENDDVDIEMNGKKESIDIKPKSTLNLLLNDIFNLKSLEILLLKNENFQNEICFYVLINTVKLLKSHSHIVKNFKNNNLSSEVKILSNVINMNNCSKISNENLLRIQFVDMMLNDNIDKIVFNDFEKVADFLTFSIETSNTYSIMIYDKEYFEEGTKVTFYKVISEFLSKNKGIFYNQSNIIIELINHELKEAKFFGFNQLHCNFLLSVTDLIWESIELSKINFNKIIINGLLKRFFKDDLVYYTFGKFFELCSISEKNAKEIHKKGLNSLININMDETAFQIFLSFLILSDILSVKNVNKANLLIDIVVNPYSKSRINIYSASKIKNNIKVLNDQNELNKSKNSIKSVEIILILSFLYIIKLNQLDGKHKGFLDENVEEANSILLEFIRSIKTENILFTNFNFNNIINTKDSSRNKPREAIKKVKLIELMESFFKSENNYHINTVSTFYEFLDQICLKEISEEDSVMFKPLNNLVNMVNINNYSNVGILESIVSFQSFLNLLDIKDDQSQNLFFNLAIHICNDYLTNSRNFSKELIKKFEEFIIVLIEKVLAKKLKFTSNLIELIIKSIVEIYNVNKKQISSELFVCICLFATSNPNVYIDFNNFKFNINKEKTFTFLIENYDTKYRYKELLVCLEMLNFTEKKIEHVEKLLKFIEHLVVKSDEINTNYSIENNNFQNSTKNNQSKKKSNSAKFSNNKKVTDIEEKYEEYSSLLIYLSNYLVIFSNVTISNNAYDECCKLLVQYYNLSFQILNKISKTRFIANSEINYTENFILVNSNILKAYEKISITFFENVKKADFLIDTRNTDILYKLYEEISKIDVSATRNKIVLSLFNHTTNLINILSESICLMKSKDNTSLIKVSSIILHSNLKNVFKHLEKDINLYMCPIIKNTFERLINNNLATNDNEKYIDDFDMNLYRKLSQSITSNFLDSVQYHIEEYGQIKLYQSTLELFEIEFEVCNKLDILKNQIDSTFHIINEGDLYFNNIFGLNKIPVEINDILLIKSKFLYDVYVKIEKEISKELQNKKKVLFEDSSDEKNNYVIEQSPLYKLNFILDSLKTLMLSVQNKKKEIIIQCLTFEKYIFESVYNMNHLENILNFLIKNYNSKNLTKFSSVDRLLQYMCQNFLNLIYSDETLKINSIDNRKRLFFTLSEFLTNDERLKNLKSIDSINASEVELLQLMVSICSNICITEYSNEDSILKITKNVIILYKSLIKLINNHSSQEFEQRNSLIYLSMSIIVFIAKFFNVFQFKNQLNPLLASVFDEFMNCYIEFLFNENYFVKEHSHDINYFLICTMEELSKSQSKRFGSNLKDLVSKMLLYKKNSSFIKTINSILLNCSKNCVFSDCYDSLVALMRKDSKENYLKKNSTVLRVVVNFMSKIIHIADKKTIGVAYNNINKLYLLIFIILEDCEDELILDQLLSSYSDYIMKINEKQFREIFEILVTLGFKKNSETKNEKFSPNMIVRSVKSEFNLENTCISLHLLSSILNSIKSFYFPYFERYSHTLLKIFQNTIEYLDSYNSYLNKNSKGINSNFVADFKKTNYTSVFGLVTTILNHIRLIYDNSKDKIIDYQFNETLIALIPNLLSLKLDEEFYENYFNKHILTAILSMFNEIRDDEVLCKFNENFLLLTKEGSYFTKYLVLKVIESVLDKLNERYLIMLEDTKEYVVELVEDGNENVSKLAFNVLKKIKQSTEMEKYDDDKDEDDSEN